MRKISQPKHQSLLYLKIFFVFLTILIFSSLVWKGTRLFQERSFTGSSFTILIDDNPLHILYIDASERKISFTTLKNTNSIKTLIPREAQFSLGFPIDAIIQYKKAKKLEKASDFFKVRNILSLIKDNEEQKLVGLNQIDLLKLYIFFHGLKYSTSSLSINPFISRTETNDAVAFFDQFRDPVIFNEKTSIEVINASGIDGLAARISKLLKYIGCNVISVVSKDMQNESKIIYRIEKNYTLNRLQKIFGIQSEASSDTLITDMTIIIGKDFADKYISDKIIN